MDTKASPIDSRTASLVAPDATAGAGKETCPETFGALRCVLPRGHAGVHASESGDVTQFFGGRIPVPDTMPDPPHVREDYRDVWLSGWRAGCRGWQPIATAPQDGTRVMVLARTGPHLVLAVARWFQPVHGDGDCGWVTSALPWEVVQGHAGTPICWQPMPLPAPPQARNAVARSIDTSQSGDAPSLSSFSGPS